MHEYISNLESEHLNSKKLTLGHVLQKMRSAKHELEKLEKGSLANFGRIAWARKLAFISET